MDNASGKLKLTIDGFGTIDASVVNGVSVIRAVDLPQVNNTYSAVIDYFGDNNYYSQIQNIIFTINKVPDVIISLPSNVTIDNELIIHVGDNTTDGKLNVTIDDGELFSVDVVNGTAVIPVIKLPQVFGNHNIKLNYYNGSYWDDKQVNTNFYSDKVVDYDFILSADVIRFGENATLIVDLPEDVNVDLTVKINGEDNTVKVINGHGVLENISGLHAGVNTVESEFYSDKYDLSQAYCNIQVNPNDMTLIITVPDEQLYVDDSAIISVKANVSMNNEITVYVNGKAQILRLSNGEGSFSINPLVYGDYVFTAIFDGNENYTYTVAGEKSFFVDKNNVTLNITTSDVVVGHDVEIKVNMDVDATGLVIVTINNMEYSLNITNKDYSLVIPRLTNGTYSVIAKYYGDDKYYAFENNTIVNVLKLTPTITANETLEVGDSLVIIIENSTSIVDNAFGQLEFTINNNTQIVDVVNGVAVITDLPRLNNIYSAVVKYLGDNNYYGKTQEIILRINKAPDVNISIPSNVAIDDDLIISIGDETCDGLVDVSINKGDAFSVNVVNGSAVIPHYYLPKVTGWYQISLSYYNATYWADKKVDNVFHEDLITVYPINITVEEDGIYATITVEVPNDITKSYGILTIDNESVEVKITDGIASYTDIFKAGNHNVDFVYEGNNKYDKYNNSIVFNKKPSELFKLNVSVEDIFVGQTAILNISLPVDGDGIVLININGTKYYLETINGITSLDINGLSYGTYNITARYLGSDLYASKTVDAILNVNKINDYELLVINSPGLDGKSCLTVFLPNDATGEVSVIINNQTFTGIVNGKSTTVDITNMVDGLNNYTLVYSGDNKYAVKRVNGTINSNGTRVDPIIIVSANDIISGETNVITVVLPDDACGNLTVKINNQDYVLSVRNMTTSIKVKFIQEGIYNVTAIYSGDVKWNSASNNTSFTVSRVDSSIKLNITDENIVAGVNFIVNVNVDVDATGNVTLNVADKKYCSVVKNGVAVFNITVESSGYYPVSAQYNGDDKYIPSQTSVVLINADKKSPVLVVEVDDINVGDNASIKITKPDDITGDIIIKVNNTIYEGLVVSGLSEGVYFVEVSYYGDLKYSNNTVNTTFKVSKVDNIIPNIVNNGSNVSVNLPSDAGGSVVVKINNDTYTVEVVNGTAVLPVNVSDDDNISITYSGDDKYESVSVDGSVDKGNILINPSMSIKLNNTINIGEEAILTVLLPVDATGFINVNVSGKIIAGDIVNGTATIHVCDLNSGINILQITYDGDKKYAKNSVSASVLVLKLNATFIIDVADIRVGENATVSINMPNDATGNVTLNGIVKALDNGKAVFILSGYSQGTYSINVSYDGDDKYNSAVNSTVFNVVKVSDVVSDVSANNSIVQLPEDITGNVLVTINNKTYNVVAVNGTVKLPVNLTDNDTFTVTYSGDDKYDSVSVSGKVSNNNVLLTPTLNLTKDKDSYSAGDIASINCVLPSDASGKVLYKVNGLNYTVLGTNGILLLPINASGTYNIEAIYSGDNKYDSVCKSISFSVVKINSTLNVLVEDTELHDDVIITVVAPVDAIGNITLIVDSVKYSNMIVNGTVVFNISNLAKGSYNVYAVFDGDNKYYKSENTSSFNVVNVNTPVDIKIDVVRVGENAVVRVKMPSHATGNVVLKSVGPDQYQEIGDNSTLVFTVPNLDVGKYNITVKYSGDEDYNSFEAHDVIKVTRSSFEYSINSTNQTHIFNSGVDFNAIFFDSFGDLLRNATVQFIVDGKTYNVTTDVNGSGVLNAMISVGNHKVIAVNPDTGYNLTFDLIINKRLTDNHDLVMFYNEGVWGVRVIGDDGKFVGAGVSVKFTIGKKTFTSVTNNAGWAYLKVKNIAHGKYTVKSECKGFSVYNKLTVKSLISAKKVSKVKKSKKKTKIFITLKGPKVKSKKNIKFKYSGKRKVVAKFGKALKGKKITVKFKGKTFKVKVNKKGKGTIKLTKKIAKKLKRGKKYKATASWKGFKVYKNKKITIKFKGKTYKVKTNKKSVATFKVTKKMVKKLKKGKKVKYTIIYGVDKQNRFIKIK